MITKEEQDTLDRIREVGQEKYNAAIRVLGEMLGVGQFAPDIDVEQKVKDAVGRMLCWLRRNWNDRRKEFEEAGLRLWYDRNYESGMYRKIEITDTDIGKWTVKYAGNGLPWEDRFSIYSEGSWDNLAYLVRSDLTATKAMEIVAAALKCISKWQSIAAKYNLLKGVCAEAYRNESLERSEKARHQLELLEKL